MTQGWRQHYEQQGASGDPVIAGGYLNAGKPVDQRSLDLVAADVLAKLDLQPTDALIDVGCGGGLALTRLRTAVRTALGVDFSLNSLRICRRDGLLVAAADGSRLPFADSLFDKVLCYGVTMHCTTLEAASDLLAELCRICRPGGRVLVGDVADVDERDRYWAYNRGQTVPSGPAWWLRRRFRTFRDDLGLVPADFTRHWGRESDPMRYAMYPAAWFRAWAKSHRVACEILRERSIPTGRGTDPYRYDVLLKP